MKRTLQFGFLLIILGCTIALSGCLASYCTNEESFIQNFEKFVDDIETNYEVFDDRDWDRLDRDFKAYADRCYPKYKEELGLNDKLSFIKNSFRYAYYRNDKDDFDLEIDGLKLDLESEVNELTENSKDELVNFIREELGPELENIVDDVLKGLEEIGNEIKEWLNTEN